eukprot:CAMPEP_0172746592 /NCGR_PEP_ID=MMETSP1074-20121228/141022_1 /TAXON_ID=2916 /ORGANISM="Ceratium fusus, Strain PA161109" /LENGTH=123 /DNA_ID=CAMNT_0013577981 /DNA_START=445 /DNA_END=813 /DNA_ORIENTATION=+
MLQCTSTARVSVDGTPCGQMAPFIATSGRARSDEMSTVSSELNRSCIVKLCHTTGFALQPLQRASRSRAFFPDATQTMCDTFSPGMSPSMAAAAFFAHPRRRATSPAGPSGLRKTSDIPATLA